jgi:hypothetical protein
MNINASVRSRVVAAAAAAAIAAAGLISLGVPFAAVAGLTPSKPSVLNPGDRNAVSLVSGPYARVFGSVIESTTGGPVADAEVNFDLVGTSSAIETVSKVNADGTFSETHLAPGTYYIFFSTPDGRYAPEAWASTSSNPVLVRPDPFILPAGVDVKEVNGVLDPASTLKGQVFGKMALTGALRSGDGYITIFGYDTDAKAWVQLGGRYFVNDDSRYSIPGVVDGVYKLQVVVHGEVITQTMGWSDQPPGPFSRELEVGGTRVTVHDIVIIPAEY